MLTPIIIVIAFCSLISAALFFLGDKGSGTITLFIGAAVIGVILFSDMSSSKVNEETTDGSSHIASSRASDRISNFLSLRDSEFHGKSN
jgi:hypothetical protein